MTSKTDPGEYRNPILHEDYSDPDVIRVGADYWMVASSFQATPGLPVLHSRDLVTWRLVNYVLDRLPWPEFDLVAHGRGVWAPSLRFHEGTFFVYFASPDHGVYLCTATDPLGAWSAPVCVKKAVGWIDPCPFWDDDGSAYLINAFANSRIGFKSVLRLNRLSPDGKQVLDEGRFVFDGQDNHLTTEGPKLSKRAGWYYVFAPAGGVKHGWQIVLRSRSVWGPYEARTVLHQGPTATNGPHQGAWVDTDTGEDWFVHFQDKGAFGRILHLQPMSWTFDWPRLGIDINGDGIGEPVERFARPRVQTTHDQPLPPPASPWQWQANPPAGEKPLGAEPFPLHLPARPLPPGAGTDLGDLPHLLARKFPAPPFRVTVTLRWEQAEVGDVAGLAVIGEQSAGVALARTATGYELVAFEGTTDSVRNRRVLQSWEGPQITLTVHVDATARCRFEPTGPETAGLTFTAVPGRWVGAKIGLFSLSPSVQRSGGKAIFESLEISD